MNTIFTKNGEKHLPMLQIKNLEIITTWLVLSKQKQGPTKCPVIPQTVFIVNVSMYQGTFASMYVFMYESV